MSKKTPHWLKQSFRELIIIVIGILLSLWISNLFQNAQENQREQVYLERLNNDLMNDLTQMKSQLAQRQYQATSARGILEAIDAGQLEDRTAFVEGFRSLLLTIRFSPNDATFRSLESTGDLRLIDNDAIVSGVMDLYRNYYEALRDNNDDVTKYRDNFLLPYTTENISLRQSLDPDQPYAPPRNLDQLYNHLTYETHTLESTVFSYEQNIKKVAALQKVLAKELAD